MMADSEDEAFFDAETGVGPLLVEDLAASPGDGFASKPDKRAGPEISELVYVFGPSYSFFFANDHTQWR